MRLLLALIAFLIVSSFLGCALSTEPVRQGAPDFGVVHAETVEEVKQELSAVKADLDAIEGDVSVAFTGGSGALAALLALTIVLQWRALREAKRQAVTHGYEQGRARRLRFERENGVSVEARDLDDLVRTQAKRAMQHGAKIKPPRGKPPPGYSDATGGTE